MAPAKKTSYSYDFKNEVLQMVKSGTKKSAVIKKYDINPELLSKWISNSDRITAQVYNNNGKVKRLKQIRNSKKGASLKRLIDKNLQEDQVSVDSSTILNKNVIDKELMPLLTEIMPLNLGKADHPISQMLINELVKIEYPDAFIVDHLTPLRAEVCYKVRPDGTIEKCWTINGHIKVEKSTTAKPVPCASASQAQLVTENPVACSDSCVDGAQPPVQSHNTKKGRRVKPPVKLDL